ncbi:MAG: GatB/YqeY domain-containing protein [Chthoniobacterales bacterium]
MSLSQQIDADIKDAMRARDAVKLGVLRMLKSSVKYAAIEKLGADGVLDDESVVPVIRKQIKQREDAIAGFEKGGRPDLVQKEQAEMLVLQAYLPAALSAEEVTAIVKDAIAEAGATSKAQMGVVMKIVQAKIAGRADGKTVSTEVQKQLP